MKLGNQALVLVLSAALTGVAAARAGHARSGASGAGLDCVVVTRPWTRDASATYFVARARPDSFLAYLWPQPPWPDTPNIPRDTLRVYGQVWNVGLLAGPDSLRLEAAFARTGRRIAVVPWDQTPDCGRAPWRRHAYLDVGRSAFIAGHLRAKQAWVHDLPTFDTDAFTDVFDSGGRGYSIDTTGLRVLPPMTPTRYFALYPILPDAQAWDQNPGVEGDKLLRWARRHPDLARRLPMLEHLWFMRQELGSSRPNNQRGRRQGT